MSIDLDVSIQLCVENFYAILIYRTPSVLRLCRFYVSYFVFLGHRRPIFNVVWRLLLRFYYFSLRLFHCFYMFVDCVVSLVRLTAV
jgi:hypothetical protein